MIRLLNTKKMKTLYISALICLLTLSGKGNPGNGDLVLLQSLKGSWLFSIGINEEWISPKFNDSGWESIKVPSPWEDQGFNGYNGYAFYRKKLTIPSLYKGRMLYLNMGYIDDVNISHIQVKHSSLVKRGDGKLFPVKGIPVISV